MQQKNQCGPKTRKFMRQKQEVTIYRHPLTAASKDFLRSSGVNAYLDAYLYSLS
jgi:hypothetical protein